MCCILRDVAAICQIRSKDIPIGRVGPQVQAHNRRLFGEFVQVAEKRWENKGSVRGRRQRAQKVGCRT